MWHTIAEGCSLSDSSKGAQSVSLLELVEMFCHADWTDEWTEIVDDPTRHGPIDWKQETFMYRYMNYLDDVKERNP